MLRRLLGLLSTYRYELRERETVVATGRLSLDEAPRPGGRIDVGGGAAIIADVTVRDGEAFLLLEIEQPWSDSSRALVAAPDVRGLSSNGCERRRDRGRSLWRALTLRAAPVRPPRRAARALLALLGDRGLAACA